MSTLDNLDKMPFSELQDYYGKLKSLTKQVEYAQLATYKPYPKQKIFHELGLTCTERALMAGNRLGKTYCAAMEVAMHAIGIYPEWWHGRKWHTKTRGLVGGESTEAIRDTSQNILLGEDRNAPGTGAIPKDKILDIVYARGVADAIDYVVIQHVTGKNSRIYFKSYEKGRKKFQGTSFDYVWLDEEPPEDVYGECLARITATSGMVFCTFTPLMGRTAVVNKFWDSGSDDRKMVLMTIDDAPHISKEDAIKAAARTGAHERDARLRGIPLLGSGLIYPYENDKISYKAFEIPVFWPRIAAIDIGTDHPTAIVWGAWDRDTDTVYIYDAYRVSANDKDTGEKLGGIPAHASALRARGVGIPVAWPHDAGARDPASAKPIKDLYKREGINMLEESARYEDESMGNGVEAGIMDIQNRIETQRLRVAEHLKDWFAEKERYHRKDGKIVKVEDDLLSATRYLIMSLRYARVVDRVGRRQKRQQGKVADGIDYDVTRPYEEPSYGRQ